MKWSSLCNQEALLFYIYELNLWKIKIAAAGFQLMRENPETINEYYLILNI